MQSWRMLEVTTIGSHSCTGSQALDNIVNMFLWQFFPDGLKGGFYLISHLKLRLELMVHFQHGTLDMVVQMH